jgi:hypothetical protein
MAAPAPDSAALHPGYLLATAEVNSPVIPAKAGIQL